MVIVFMKLEAALKSLHLSIGSFERLILINMWTGKN